MTVDGPARNVSVLLIGGGSPFIVSVAHPRTNVQLELRKISRRPSRTTASSKAFGSSAV